MPVKRRKGKQQQGKQGKQGKHVTYSNAATSRSSASTNTGGGGGSNSASRASTPTPSGGAAGRLLPQHDNNNNNNTNATIFGDGSDEIIGASAVTSSTAAAAPLSSSSSSRTKATSKQRQQSKLNQQQKQAKSTSTKEDTGFDGTISVYPNLSVNPNDLILTCTEKRRGAFECDYCHNDISQLPRIRCAVCTDFDLCLDCFATVDHVATLKRLKATSATQNALQEEGVLSAVTSAATTASSTGSIPSTHTSMLTTAANISNHDPSHGYRVCDSTRFPLFPTSKQISDSLTSSTTPVTAEENDTPTSNDNLPVAFIMQCESDAKNYWTAEEDLRLIEGIRTHGLGNWADVAEAVGGYGSTGKTPKRCMERYFDDFLGRYGSILPPYTFVPLHANTARKAANDTAASGSSSTIPDDKNEEPKEKNQPSETTTETTGKSENSETTNDMNTDNAASSSNSNVLTSPDSMNATRVSKRRAAMIRSPAANANVVVYTSFSQLEASGMSTGDFLQYITNTRKRFKAIPAESIIVDAQQRKPETTKNDDDDDEDNKGLPESSLQNWPAPYLPKIRDKEVKIGQEVGRDQATKAESLYVKTIAACESKEQVAKICKEWTEARLNKPGGPTVLPMRPEDIVTLPGCELAGYMPRRGDFDVEWENDAEEAIADMEFIAGESEEDRQLKLRVLEIYNRKLEEREQRKNFIISRSLYDYRKHQEEFYNTLPKDERDLVLRMRLFERFHTPEEHKAFIADILKAKRLRKEIAKLQMYRRMGIRTLAEAEMYELDKQRRNFHKSVAVQRSIDNGRAAGEQSNMMTSSSMILSSHSAGGLSDSANDMIYESDSISYWKQYRKDDRTNRKSINRGNNPSSSNDLNPGAEATKADGHVMEIDGNETLNQLKKTDKPTVHTNSSAALAGEKINDLPQFEIHSLPGYNLLSPKEVKLCQSIRIVPAQYLDIKRCLIHESFLKGLMDESATPGSKRVGGGTSTNSASTLMKLDIERRGPIIDFVVSAGWISAQTGQIAKSG